MKKKKQKYSAGATSIATSKATTSASIPTDKIDLKALIHDHSLFFDKLIDLIPPKFYLSTDNQEKVWRGGLSKAAKAEAKRQSIENIKISRRDRLDPEKAGKTTVVLLQESINSEKAEKKRINENADDDSDQEGGVQPANSMNLVEDERSVTYEELRQRLRKKIEELRAGRGGGEIKVWEKNGGEKRKRNEESGERNEYTKKKKQVEEEKKIEKEVLEAAKGLEFGKVNLGTGSEYGKNNKRKKLSKEKELEIALKLEETKKNDPEKAKEIGWKAAMERAKGKKIHDNPKKLKESLQREKRKHKKSVEKWEERVSTIETSKQEKQEKRKANIQAKIDAKKERRLEKRENKRLRAGFEGRNEVFVNGT